VLPLLQCNEVKLVGLVIRMVLCFLSRALGILDLAVGMYYAYGSSHRFLSLLSHIPLSVFALLILVCHNSSRPVSS
jgi:hypothetical protein